MNSPPEEASEAGGWRGHRTVTRVNGADEHTVIDLTATAPASPGTTSVRVALGPNRLCSVRRCATRRRRAQICVVAQTPSRPLALSALARLRPDLVLVAVRS